MLGAGDMGGLPELPNGAFVDRTLGGAAATGLNFFVVSNLNLLRDGGYTFILTGRNTTGAADSLWMSYNGDQTGTNYQRNGISVNASSPSYPTSAAFGFLTLRENADFVATFRIYPAGYTEQRVAAECKIFSGDTATVSRFDTIWQNWIRGSGENVTQIEFNSSNNIIGAGARLMGRVGAW